MIRTLSFLLIFQAYILAEPTTIKIGVLAKRGIEHTHKKWDETARFLSKAIPSKRFEIVPIPFNDIFREVENKSIDFMLANSGFYVELEYKYGVQRITTLVNKHISGLTQKEFGGVIFTHKDNAKRFESLENVKGTVFGAVNPRSFGGWQMGWRELLENGIGQDDILLEFEGTHDKVVYAVLNKKVEVGTVRTDTLDRMAL